MEETLGKRIVFHRKRLGLTQDALAELMGVLPGHWRTAEAGGDL